MTEIERKALALVNEVREDRDWSPHLTLRRRDCSRIEALCRAIEQHEALEAENERLREALGLADAALRGANMNMNVVERKLRAALEARHD